MLTKDEVLEKIDVVNDRVQELEDVSQTLSDNIQGLRDELTNFSNELKKSILVNVQLLVALGLTIDENGKVYKVSNSSQMKKTKSGIIVPANG